MLDKVRGKPVGKIEPEPGHLITKIRWLFGNCENCGLWARAYVSISVKSDGTIIIDDYEVEHTNQRNDSKCAQPKLTITG
jgi:hypothetical protein